MGQGAGRGREGGCREDKAITSLCGEGSGSNVPRTLSVGYAATSPDGKGVYRGRSACVFGGTNDSWANAPLGEPIYEDIKEADLFCVLPAFSYFAKRLKEVLPETRTVFIGNCDIKTEITDAMRDICAHYGLTYIPLSDIDKLNGHPTECGMQQICDRILENM